MWGTGTVLVNRSSPGELVARAELVERALEHLELGRLEPVHDLVLQILQMDGQPLVELPLAGRAEHDPLDPAVVRARLALDEPGRDDPVDEARGAPARAPELHREVAHREPAAGGAADPEQHLEEGATDPALLLERAVEGAVEAPVGLVEQPEGPDPLVVAVRLLGLGGHTARVAEDYLTRKRVPEKIPASATTENAATSPEGAPMTTTAPQIRPGHPAAGPWTIDGSHSSV